MKTLPYLIIAILLSTSYTVSSQSTVNPDLSLEAQSIIDEGAIHNIRYYYYPNLQAYFDTDTGTYLYINGNEWVEANKLPRGLRGYSLLNDRRVAITDYYGNEPYNVFDQHKEKFPANYDARRQPPAKENEGIAFN
ncbi:MAG: hypothetical protein ITG00_06230 [Flavobacterium sp.]|nr:hypothetical protein [Flavobacterium sp.]